MKKDILANTSDEPQGVIDVTLENSSLSGETSDGETMDATGDINVIQELKQKLASAETTILYQNEKNKLYEATIKDKNDLIKSLNTSIELINQNKELMIKQLRDEITDLQDAPDLSKNPTINQNANQVKFKKKDNSGLQTLQKPFDESQSQNASLPDNISQLKAEMAELKSKFIEKVDEIAILAAKSTTEEDKLRATIADLENKAKIYEVDLKDKDAKIAKYTSNVECCESTDAPIDVLSGSKWPNIKLIKIGDKKMPPLIVNTPHDGVNWMVILRRFNGSQDFNMNSCSYEKGFGEVSGEFWLGLESIHQLTTSRRHELCVEFVDLDNKAHYAIYDNFVLSSKGESYALKSLGAYSGDIGYDALKYCIGGIFVYDTSRNYYWWFRGKHMCCLTGKYTISRKHNEDLTGGMYWCFLNIFTGNASKYAAKACKMLIRPKL